MPRGLTLPDAEQFALVLAAAGINCRLVALDGAVTLAVARPDADRARRAVSRADLIRSACKLTVLFLTLVGTVRTLLAEPGPGP